MAMDVARPERARRRKIRRIIYVVLALAIIPLVTLALSRLKPAAPTVERATVWLDTVKRGPFIRNVRGLGTLVPEEIIWIPATTDGRVERRLALPGTVLQPDTVILELTNPELEQALLDAEWKLKGAEADLANLKVKLQSERMTQQAAAATVRSDYQQARLQADRDAELNRLGLLADLNAKLSRAKAEDLANRDKIEQKRLEIGVEAIQAQLAVQQSTVEQLRALCALKRNQVEALKVRAGIPGVLQQVPVEVGQRVAVGANLARVAQPQKLKAELKIAETQAKDIQIGQQAEVDTRNGIILGRVSRIDPAVQQGTVTVDVRLEGELPPGARPDLSVDGTIEIEKLADLVQVGRPTFGQPYSTVGLFKLEADGRHASRAQVKLGRSAVNSIEIVEGLRVGDQVILSDMSAWDAYDRIRLN
ncbi:MAG: HlyD family efflux transporter periplasmic adaptor subunit [Acidobacteria bacterium]|nr:HlyD family efflux transporter periplasmic adaptor subunit [Acidobacteriota bacterium]